MTSLIDYILSLFRSEDAARSFVAAPGRAMTSAGLIDIAPHQISSVAANVVPGLNLGAGDPMSGLRQAVAARHGFAQDVANVGFAGDAGAGVASVITTDVGAGLASGLGAGFLGQGGLALAASSGGFGGQVGLAAQVGLGFTAVIEAEVGAQVGAGLGIGTGLGAQAGMGFGGGVGLGLGGQAGGVIGGSAAGAIGAGVGGRLGGNGQIGVATPVEHGLVLPSGPLIHGGTGGYGGMNPPVTDAPAPQVPARAQPMTTAAEHTPAVTQPQHTPVEPPVHDKPPSHSVFDVGHEPPVTHTPPAPIELPSYGLFGLPGF